MVQKLCFDLKKCRSIRLMQWFMDIRMPVMNGLEAAAAIRAGAKADAKTIPIIADVCQCFCRGYGEEPAGRA